MIENNNRKDSLTLKLVAVFFFCFVVLGFYCYLNGSCCPGHFQEQCLRLYPEKWRLCLSESSHRSPGMQPPCSDSNTSAPACSAPVNSCALEKEPGNKNIISCSQ
jgi:hypothetical protein